MKIMQNKKGQGMPVNVIIIAVLALLVMVIVAFVFTGKFAEFSKRINDCEAVAGNACEYSCAEGYTQDSSRKCFEGNKVDTSKVCCVPVSA